MVLLICHKAAQLVQTTPQSLKSPVLKLTSIKGQLTSRTKCEEESDFIYLETHGTLKLMMHRHQGQGLDLPVNLSLT